MSKFTDALKIIDAERAAEKKARREAPGAPGLHVPGNPGEKTLSWDTGIQMPKNAHPDHRVVAYHFPNSLVSEQYRMLRTSLKTRLQDQQIQVLMVSSSIHSEGKSVTSTNLALSLAEDEEVKVLLIDADLRRGKIHDYLGIGSGHAGLAELLQENISPKRAIYKNSKDNFAYIPRGSITKNPSNLIGTQRFRMLLAELRAHYHYIIVDAPPIMSVADPGIMAREVDGVLFVIQIGRTPKSMISHASQLFRNAGANMLGYVLTNVEFHSADYRYYKDYYEHYATDNEKKGFREKARRYFRKTGFGLEKAEKNLTDWCRKKDE